MASTSATFIASFLSDCFIGAVVDGYCYCPNSALVVLLYVNYHTA